MMQLRAVLAVLIFLPAVGGCGSMQKIGGPLYAPVTLKRASPPEKKPTQRKAAQGKASQETTATKWPGMKRQKSPVSEAVGDSLAADAESTTWMAATRRRLAQVAKDIQSDLDFHESEGVDSFSPDAAEQVRFMRAEMGGPAYGGQ